MACFKKSVKRRKMTNFSATWKAEFSKRRRTAGENLRAFQSFPAVCPLSLLLYGWELLSWPLPHGASNSCISIRASLSSWLHTPNPRQGWLLGQNPLPWWGSSSAQLGNCSGHVWSPHTHVPTSANSERWKLVPVVIIMLIFLPSFMECMDIKCCLFWSPT